MVGSYCPSVSGPTLVQVNLRDGNGFVSLGYTTDGVQLEEMFYTNPIHSDQYGGSAGPEVDRQFMGKSARIGLSLVTYNIAVVKKMREGQASTNWTTGAAGTHVQHGGLVTCGNRAFQILLLGEADIAAAAAGIAVALNYPNCWYDGPVKFPIGSKNTVWDLDIKATPFTTDTVVSGDGLTRLYMENSHVVTNMATYTGTTQAP